jgi:N-methylhydantoinase A/oxoprolinase/acetone carboxylase beta subunit/N-methylhydantoinase B/oxoprolinase/acetone carboxylase alpha subunit
MIIEENMKLRFGVDTGGTFTDLVIEGIDEHLRLYKQPTTPSDPIQGLLDVVGFAANELDMSVEQLLGQAETLVHGTTRATNAIVEHKTARTGFITTRGHRDMLVVREGGGRSDYPMDYSQEYPKPYIPRSLSYEVPERIFADGRVIDVLDEATTLQVIEKLKEQKVEAVAVCLLWSMVNPAHEIIIGKLLDENLPGVPYTLSHQLNPTVREYRRASSTAIDASLKPLMGEYIRNLEVRLQEAGFAGRLLVLTASGGVLDASDIWNTPIHTIGSGPAAAPIAGRHFAKLDANTNTAIITDAGGTTYDVGLVQNGQIPWTRENMVAGQKQGFITGFAAVDVRSVGAGGGSIGWVDDGGLLHVGPESAGSDPGPACWGRGGTQPTVTDACVVLGYVDPDFYLGGTMQIDVVAAEKAIMEDVGEPLGLNLEETAAAIFDLACQNMVVAIEDITLTRGIDHGKATMIGGGGGGGLYSATIASKLGVKQIVIPSVSAALSAAGALLSDLRRDFSSTSMMLSTVFDFATANQILADLKSKCDEFAAVSGSDNVTIRYSIEARYPDQAWEIEVPLRGHHYSDEQDLACLLEDFHKTHLELFAIEDVKSSVEIIAWRAEVSCKLYENTASTAEFGETVADVNLNRRAYFQGTGWVDGRAYRAEEIKSAAIIDGPAFIELPVTTIIVPPNANATKLDSSSFIVVPGISADQSQMQRISDPETKMSGHELAMLNSQLESVVIAMRNTLLRTARSAVMNMARDFVCGILTAENEVLAACEGIPCMIMSGPDIQARYIKQWHPQMRQGDAFVHNDPYTGNTHAADWTIFMPVIDDSGEHLATVYAKAHMADCGNSIPTTFFATAKDVYEEGALIFPGTKVQTNYELHEDFIRQCRVRIRVADTWYGDFLAMMGACRIGEQRLQELIKSLPENGLESFSKDWMDYSERRMASALKELPGGNTRVTLHHDPVPGAEDGVPVNVDLKSDPEKGKILIDLRDNIDCLPFGMNLSESTITSAAMFGVFSSIRQHVPLNAGSFRRIEVLLREGCMIGIPKHPFSCSVATTNLSELAGKAVTLGFAKLGDGFGLAELGRHMPPAMAVVSGFDPRPGRGAFQNFLCLLVCNGPGAPNADGWLTSIGLGVAGLQQHDPIEVDEMKYPILIRSQYLMSDTEGAGRHTGAPSAYVEYEPVDTTIEALFTSDGTVNAPIGVRGGGNGAKAQQFKRNKEGELEVLDLCARVTVEPGETLVSICTGAGGYGLPITRDLNRVAHDVREGYVTEERAKIVYGVVLNKDGNVDDEGTAKLRGQMQDTNPEAITGNSVSVA